MNRESMLALAQSFAPIVREYCATQTAPLVARIAALEAREMVPGPRGEPGQAGVSIKGDPGPSGVGLASGLIDSGGVLFLTLTDGSLKSLGRVVGQDGTDGKPGEQGLPGKDADVSVIDAVKGDISRLDAELGELKAAPREPGPKGDPGKSIEGPRGPEGRGIADVLIDRSGNLIIVFTDGTTESLGPVVGKDGEPGKSAEAPIVDAVMDAAALADIRTELDVLNGAVSEIAARDVAPGQPGEKGADASDEQVAAAVAKHLAANPPPKGEPGSAAESVQPEQITEAVSAYLKAHPPPIGPKGDPGESVKGEPGEAAAPVQPEQIAAVVLDYLKANPPPAGKEGAPGTPGAPGESIKGEPGRGIAEALIGADGNLAIVMTDGSVKSVGRVVGHDGEDGSPGTPGDPGQNGTNGLGFDDMSSEWDGERTLTLRWVRGETKEERVIVFPVPFDKGVYKAGTPYIKGDGVSFGGSFWLAQRDTDAKPDAGTDDWRLSTKKGRDGKSAYDIARAHGFTGTEADWVKSLKGEPGKEGPPGRIVNR